MPADLVVFGLPVGGDDAGVVLGPELVDIQAFVAQERGAHPGQRP